MLVFYKIYRKIIWQRGIFWAKKSRPQYFTDEIISIFSGSLIAEYAVNLPAVVLFNQLYAV